MEGDFHNLAGPRGNNTFLRTKGETATESGIGAWQLERGINKTIVGHQNLDKKSSFHKNSTVTSILYKIPEPVFFLKMWLIAYISKKESGHVRKMFECTQLISFAFTILYNDSDISKLLIQCLSDILHNYSTILQSIYAVPLS